MSDPLYHQIMEFTQKNERISVSVLQRKFSVGYMRAFHLLEQLEADGYITADPSKNENSATKLCVWERSDL